MQRLTLNCTCITFNSLGIELDEGEINYTAYADDVILLMKITPGLKLLLGNFQQFASKANLEINTDKIKILPLKAMGRVQKVMAVDHKLTLNGNYNNTRKYMGINFEPNGIVNPDFISD